MPVSARSCLQAVAAVFGQAHHAALLTAGSVPRCSCAAWQAPAPHGRVEHRPDDQRAVVHQHPLDGLERHAGPAQGMNSRATPHPHWRSWSPGRGRLAVHHRDLVPGAGQVIRAGGADDATAEDENFHRLLQTVLRCATTQLAVTVRSVAQALCQLCSAVTVNEIKHLGDFGGMLAGMQLY
jgi:hypothetical protein